MSEIVASAVHPPENDQLSNIRINLGIPSINQSPQFQKKPHLSGCWIWDLTLWYFMGVLPEKVRPFYLDLWLGKFMRGSGHLPGAYVFSHEMALLPQTPTKSAEGCCGKSVWNKSWGSTINAVRVSRGHTYCSVNPCKAVRIANATWGKTVRKLRYSMSSWTNVRFH